QIGSPGQATTELTENVSFGHRVVAELLLDGECLAEKWDCFRNVLLGIERASLVTQSHDEGFAIAEYARHAERFRRARLPGSGVALRHLSDRQSPESERELGVRNGQHPAVLFERAGEHFLRFGKSSE